MKVYVGLKQFSLKIMMAGLVKFHNHRAGFCCTDHGLLLPLQSEAEDMEGL